MLMCRVQSRTKTFVFFLLDSLARNEVILLIEVNQEAYVKKDERSLYRKRRNKHNQSSK